MVARFKNNANETASLGVPLANDPKAFPGAFVQVLKRWFRAVWNARGGGLYACGFFITFVWLETSMFFGEIMGAESIGSFFTEQFFEFLLRFSILSFQNTISAFIWPVYIINLSPVWGGISIAMMFVLFGKLIKKPLEIWLFGHEIDEPTADDVDQDPVAR